MSVSIKGVFKTAAAAVALSERPTIIVAFHNMIDFFPAFLPHVAGKHLPGQRVKLKTEGVAEPVRPDLRALPGLPHEWVVRGD